MVNLSTKEQVFEKLGKPDSPDAVASVEKFIKWRDCETFEDFIQIEWRGSLKSKDIASQIEEEQNTKFAKSALTQNKWVRHLREELEDYLRGEGVLPDQTKKAKEEDKKGRHDNPKTHNSNKRQASLDANRLKDLEEENMQLKARLAKLEDDINVKKNIYADLAEMGADFGS